MQLSNTFDVALPPGDAWTLLTDLPRIAPCLPGAHLDGVTDGSYHGGLSVKLGPITADYSGAAEFLERDDIAHRAVIAARGREKRGSGTAQATITATLHPHEAGTRVELDTRIAISGRAAQFGRSLLADVSTAMLTDFARRLEATIASSSAEPGGQPPAAVQPPLDMARTALLPAGRRAAPALAVGVVAGLLGWLIGRHQH